MESIDRAFQMPDILWSIPEADRPEKARWNKDFCVMDERGFIRTVLTIPIQDSEGSLNLGVWCEVDRPAMKRYREIYTVETSPETIAGTLANEIPGYTASLGEKVSIVIGDATHRPRVVVDGSSSSALRFDQQRGISAQKLESIVARSASGPQGAVKVEFSLFPEPHSEYLMCLPVGGDRYKLDEVPLYVYGISYEDEFEADTTADKPHPVYRHVTTVSGNTTYRVAMLEEPINYGTMQTLLDKMKAYSTREATNRVDWIAFSVPEALDDDEINRFLDEGEEKGLWSAEISNEFD